MGTKYNPTIHESFGVKVPVPFKVDLVKIDKTPPEYAIDSNIVIGIEVEVENAAESAVPRSGVWTVNTDGSLRNGGREFITNPIQASAAPFALRELLGKTLQKTVCFSPRTSIHVHVNCTEYTFEQVKNISLMYGLLEHLFYKFVAKGRRKNIYCVPISETNLWQHFNQATLSSNISAWRKYTGYNLRPLSEIGTVEFRQMHGTFDYGKVSIWIRLITKLVEYAASLDTKSCREQIAEFGPATDIPAFLQKIFGADAAYLKYSSFNEDFKFTTNTLRLAFVTKVDVYKVIHPDLGIQDSAYAKAS
jgi:hypothetical protein